MSACHSCAAAARLLGSTLPSARRGNRRPPLAVARPWGGLGPSVPGPSRGLERGGPFCSPAASLRGNGVPSGRRAAVTAPRPRRGLPPPGGPPLPVIDSRERGPPGQCRSGVGGEESRSGGSETRRAGPSRGVPCCSAAIRASVRPRVAASALFFSPPLPLINLLLVSPWVVRGDGRWRVRIKGSITVCAFLDN